MQITLSPELEKHVREQMARGGYSDVREFVAEALAAYELHLPPPPGTADPDGPYQHPWTFEKLKRAIQVAVDQADRGESAEWNAGDVIARGKRILEERKQARG